MKTRANIHEHFGWETWADCIQQIKALENPWHNILLPSFNAGLNISAFTDINAEGGRSFWDELLMPFLKRLNTACFGVYNFEIENPDTVRFKDGNKECAIIRTREVLSKSGHILAVGADKALAPGRTAGDTAKEIRDSKGLVIPAHCLSYSGIGEKRVRELREKDLVDALEENGFLWKQTPITTFAYLFSFLPGPQRAITQSTYLANIKVRRLALGLDLPLIRTNDGHDGKIEHYSIYSHPTNLQGVSAINYAIKNRNISIPKDTPKTAYSSLRDFLRHAVNQFNNPERRGLPSPKSIEALFQ